jgi:PAS domain S-box-containing protein
MRQSRNSGIDSSSRKPKSLYRKLTVAIVVLVVLVSFAGNLINYLYSSHEAKAIYESKSSEYAVYLREALEWPLWNIDDELIMKIGSAFASNTEIVSLTIRDDQQRVVYQQEKPNGNQVKREITIEHNGQNIGSVEIGLSLGMYEARDRQLLLTSIAAMVLLIIVLLVATRWILSRLLKKPVDAFVGATRNMVEGKYRQIELPETYMEFAPVLSSFKTMSEAVANRESSLRASEQKLFTILESVDACIYLKDVEGRYLFANRPMRDLSHVEMEDIIGFGDDKFFDAATVTRIRHIDDQVLKGGEILRSEEINTVVATGQAICYQYTKLPLRREDGSIYALCGISIDITDRKKAEEELNQFKDTLDQTLDSIFMFRENDFHFIYVNEGAIKQVGYTYHELMEMTPLDIKPEFTLERFQGMVQPLRDGTQSSLTFDTVHRHKNGHDIPVEIFLQFVRKEGKDPRYVAIVRDITERKKTEEELRLYKDHLEEEVQQRTADLVLALNAAEAANRAKSVFLSNMSHELRTPLNAILGFSNMMRKDLLLSQEQRENLDIINRSGEHLLTLINDVLEMAKIEAGRVQLEKAPFDLGSLVRDVTDMMHLRAQEKGLQLLIDQSSEFPRYIKGDEARLRQVLINLVGNAVKFTEDGGVTVRFGMKPQTTPQRLLIEVEDSGIGISTADQQKIFEPFVQLENTAIQKGTGLGLTITRQFVQLMGGSISVESIKGTGSTFRVELPVNKVTAADVTKPESMVRGDITGLAPDQPEYRILIVEDQLENQLLLAKLMKNVGFPVKVAENGEQALELFQSWRPHLIWMDRRMPKMDGLEATRRIRELPGGREVKIVAVTASAFMEQRVEMLDAGIDEFVRKPYRFNEIYECLTKQLGVQYT